MNPPALVLIVDDIAANRLTLRELLASPDYRLIEAADGPTALRLAAETRPDLVLLDLMMPGMDGYEVCRRLRADSQLAEVPVIIVTALDEPAARLAGIEAGADDFVIKPFNHTELRARVRTITRLNRYRGLLEAKAALQTEVVEHTKAEESLRMLGAAVEQSNESIMIMDTEPAPAGPKILFVNPAFTRMTGYSADEVLGKTPRALQGQSFDPSVLPRLGESSGHPGFIGGETINHRKDGTAFDLEWQIAPIRSITGVLTHFVAVQRDITERKKTDRALRASEESYRDLFENAFDLILSVAPDGRLLYANRAWHEALGYGPEDLATVKLQDLINPDRRDESAKSFAAVAQGKEVELVETEFVSKSGKRISVEGSVSAKSVKGRTVSLRCIFRDVTEKKKTEAQNLRNQRMESLGTLAGGVAHDLNNVLSPILLAVECLRTRLADPASVKILDVLEGSAQRGADMVRQVLTFSRGVEGKRAEVSLKYLIAEMREIIQHTFPKSIVLRTDVPKDTWTLMGDATQIHQVLLNLCVNARDAMTNGGTLTLKVENVPPNEQFARIHSEATAGPYIVLSVIDTGVGIPAHVQKRMFDPFFSTKPLEKGTGLGLSTVRGIVKGHHGFISLSSEVGKGSQFKVWFPAAPSFPARPEQTHQTPLPMGHGQLILVVDDEAAILSVTRQSLQAFGYRTLTAINGAQAVAMCAQNVGKISLMLTDIMMPIMDGAATIRAVRLIDPKLKIIASSGLGPEDGTADPRALNADAFLRKPYTAEQLLRVLATVLA